MKYSIFLTFFLSAAALASPASMPRKASEESISAAKAKVTYGTSPKNE
jgi:hypothetical protein